ncbi:MAG: hypothetical protein BWK73_32890 [Thiothrix lacustris]|jgi:hypothetical protein|uniref:Uncharacterized protein n=1 Tax=Thiothrix lacustris TaxID=525917 RepID=A0A1Y1QHB0_9GAMM|nr:MAG: hypothetical protein BWK73_32890 [Thiothrix lacustris]
MAKKSQRGKIGLLVDKYNERIEKHTHVYLEVSYKEVSYRLKVRKNLYVLGDWNEEKQECDNAGVDVLLERIDRELQNTQSFASVLVMLAVGEVEQFKALPTGKENQKFAVVVDALECYINTYIDIPTSSELWNWLCSSERQFLSGYHIEKATREQEGVVVSGQLIGGNLPLTYSNLRQIFSRKIGLKKPEITEVTVIKKSTLVTFSP